MDSCHIDILTRIGDFLPWRDRLRFEQLSSRFRNLPCQPVENEKFNLEIIANQLNSSSILFKVGVGESMSQRYILDLTVVIGDKSSNCECCKAKGIKKTFESPSQGLDYSISLLHRLMAIFSFQTYFINCSNMPVLGTLAELLNSKHKARIPKKLSMIFEMEKPYLPKDEFNPEEWALLESLNGIYSFTIDGPEKLRKTEKERFERLPWLHTAKKLALFFGLDYGNSILNPYIDIGINDEFLQKLIDRKAEVFCCNLICFVTREAILRFVRNSLSGSHALTKLTLYTSEKITASDLLPLGFSVNDANSYLNASIVVACREEKKERTPDRIIVTSSEDKISILRYNTEYLFLAPKLNKTSTI